MKIEIHTFEGNYDGKRCLVHARAGALDRDNLVITLQYLNVAGSDDFSPLLVSQSHDGGKSWTPPAPDPSFTMEYADDGTRYTWCDATHLFHKKTGIDLACGHSVSYAADAVVPILTGKTWTCYSSFDPAANRFTGTRRVEMPGEYLRGAATGCSQFIEEENGDLLIPVTIHHGEEFHSNTGVMRCSFDGFNLTFLGMSNELSTPIARGFGEGSLVKFGGKYYLTLRTDDAGFVSVSEDGKNFTEPQIWRWDTEEVLPNYNTQQHWLTCGGKLYLVYTRKAGNNDHVFRHRAPLFMAEVDPDTLRILRHTEVIVVPERGARLGNFGVTQIDDNTALITVTEWMQPAGCEKHGSTNALFVTRVSAD
ncbi:MAG: exo-alpha-sialidase [Clostridia bacterium]|nr:exo-alpha-sialidase [Clostridia bacterium]